jgi:SAM-dependent methyltransferase
MDLKEQLLLGDNAHLHWYYRAKSAAMLRLLGDARIDKVLDIGAGSGFFSRYLLDHTACREAVCVDPNYPAETSEMQGGKPISFIRGTEKFDGRVMLMMDVLEHVADDVGLLRHYAAAVPPGTLVLITVPAMPWMWSGHDVFLEHYRRYTVASLSRVIEAAGLRPRSVCYYFGLTLPLAALVRLGRRLVPGRAARPGSDMRVHTPLVNAALLRICRVELGLFQHNRLAGLSVFALAETTGDRSTP